MSAPSATARGTPSGIMQENGFRTLVTFSLNPTLSVWEIDVQEPELKTHGDAINTTTMHTIEWAGKAPPALKESGDGSLTVGFDPAAYTQIKAMLGVKQVISYTEYDGSTEAHHGYIASFQREAKKINEMPTAKITIVHTERDPSGAEQSPVLADVAGT